MSRHLYCWLSHEPFVYVLIGWDRSLHYHFMVVYAATASEPVYSNIFEPAGCLSLRAYLDKLTRWGIDLPAVVVIACEADTRCDRGNHDVLYRVVNGQLDVEHHGSIDDILEGDEDADHTT